MIDTYVGWNLCLVSIALAITVTITLPDGPQQKATTLSHNSDDDDALCTQCTHHYRREDCQT